MILQKTMQQFYSFLSKKGLKNTPQRRLIVETFLRANDHVTTEDLYGLVRDIDPKIGQATVYRTLRLLCEAGIARELHFGGGMASYEPTEGEHHDHLICTSCGKNLEVVDETIERLQEKLAADHGFSLTAHRMYLYGVCPDCAKSKKK